MLSIQIRNKKGSADDMYLDTDKTVPIPTPGINELLVRVFSTGINRADTIQRSGNYPPPPGDSEILGLELAGIVEQVGGGDGGERNFKKGDRVLALVGGGSYAEFCLVHKDVCIQIPSTMSMITAASIPENFLTAYQCLHFVGQLAQNETVLIHAGGSGVGLAAIQLAKLVPGVKVITTAGSDHKLQKCKDLGADHTINYKQTPDFATEVLSITSNQGVNLILDFIGGPYFQKNLDSLTIEGRLVLIGWLGGSTIEGTTNLGAILRKRLRIEGTTLRSRSISYKKKLFDQFCSTCLSLFDQTGPLKVVIDSIFELKDASKAHQRMESNDSLGKILLKVQDE